MADAVKTPYDSAKKLINSKELPTWLNDYDALRLASYDLYEDIYWTRPDTFKLQQRGTEANPIYIPNGRVIVNTMDRYTGKGWAPILDPLFGTPNDQTLALTTFIDLFKRERMGSQYESNKLFGLIRADWAWYITANPLKPQGSRISIKALDPRSLFPIAVPGDPTSLWGVDIVDYVVAGDDKYIKRVRYLKSEHPDHPSGAEAPGGPISFQIDYLDPEKWETEPKNAVLKVPQQAVPPTLMPTLITKLPVYHIKNFDEPGNPFGSSEMRGIERLFAAVNQSVTDEELALALEGLGMYSSEKGQPRDPVTNAVTPWVLGPGRVVHDGSFKRVNGVQTITPFTDHISYLEGKMDEINGASDVARGKVDVTVAESGIALQIRLAPILDASGKKDVMIREVMDNFLFDMRDWLASYEGINLNDARLVSSFGQKVPVDAQDRFSQLLQMVSASPPLITQAYFRDAVRELGIPIPATVTGQAIADEQAQFAAASDPTGARLDAEANGATTDPNLDGSDPEAP